MLSAEEHPGIFTFMVGIIVLVMAGVGLSLVIDRRLNYSSGVVKKQREINLEAMELEHLTAWHSERSHLLNESELKLQKGAATNGGILGELKNLHQRQAVLEEMRRELGKRIFSLEDAFSHYRADYRRKTWLAAVGENLGNLKVRSGREYKQAAITRVTDVGLEIRHEDGIARIQAPDLDSKLQDRFQWSDEERRQVLGQEQQDLEGNAKEAIPDDSAPADWTSKSSVPEVSRFQTEIAPDSAEVAALRRLVVAWRVKVNLLSGEHQEAMSRAGYGSQSSVPGSLETWSARASRLGKALARAQGELAVAKARLAVDAPSDPLLRPSLQGL
jgi:hypothetical protein